MMAPTTACELETGTSGMVGRPREESQLSRPTEENRNSTSPWAMTTIRAEMGESWNSRDPTVSITRFE